MSDIDSLKVLMKAAPDLTAKKMVLELQLKKGSSIDVLVAECIKAGVLDAPTGFQIIKEVTDKIAKKEADKEAAEKESLKKLNGEDPMTKMKNMKQSFDTKMAEMQASVPTMRKKVLVSGCFDLLHSGHVEFFQQAAQLGDLYVFIGSDKNIESLKKHKSMYSEAERLYMVKAVKGVKDGAVSKGMGRFDFLDDIKTLRPDIYFVNDDAGKLDERIKMVEDLNICKVVVAPRKPAEGLEERSSSSMKTRLRDMVLQDAKLQCLVKCLV